MSTPCYAVCMKIRTNVSWEKYEEAAAKNRAKELGMTLSAYIRYCVCKEIRESETSIRDSTRIDHLRKSLAELAKHAKLNNRYRFL